MWSSSSAPKVGVQVARRRRVSKTKQLANRSQRPSFHPCARHSHTFSFLTRSTFFVVVVLIVSVSWHPPGTWLTRAADTQASLLDSKDSDNPTRRLTTERLAWNKFLPLFRSPAPRISKSSSHFCIGISRHSSLCSCHSFGINLSFLWSLLSWYVSCLWLLHSWFCLTFALTQSSTRLAAALANSPHSTLYRPKLSTTRWVLHKEPTLLLPTTTILPFIRLRKTKSMTIRNVKSGRKWLR